VRVAYRVKDHQISGPDWLASQRFDIVAKLPEGASREQVPEMLQSLLVERFKLALHRDKKEHTAYALVVGKNGPKLHPSEGGAAGPGGTIKIGRGHLEVNKTTVSNFADMLSRLVDRPVLDMTELQGRFDFTLDFAPEGMKTFGMIMGAPAEKPAESASEPSGPSIFTAVQEQLGLKLEARKAPVEILVIDHIEKVPTEN
jgi:uncharacterized protein (TIGR03435 family)